MIRPPPMSTRTATLIPYPALFRAARSGINPQDAEYHRRAGKDEGGITLGRRHPPDRLDTALVQDLVFFWREIGARQRARNGGRSEEHTSELQSQMRISYAVFCLIKKTSSTKPPTTHTRTRNR